MRSRNRIICWCHARVEYEGDTSEMEWLSSGRSLKGTKPLATPSAKATFKKPEDDSDRKRCTHSTDCVIATCVNYVPANIIDAQLVFSEDMQLHCCVASHGLSPPSR